MTADTCYIVDEENNNRVYGTIERSASGSVTNYTLSTNGANVDTFTSVNVATDIASVTFDDSYFIRNAIPITYGDATFNITAANNNRFAVTYDYTTAHPQVASAATAVTLLNGTLNFSSSAQTITAGSKTVRALAGTLSVTYDGSNVTIGSMDTAGDSVIVNETYTYTYSAGNGMTIEIASDGSTTFKNLDDDTFVIDGVTYKKTANAFVKTNADGSTFMWTNNDIDVGTSGVTVSQLNGDNWTQTAQVNGGNLTINNASTATVVLVGDVTDPASAIYGTLIVSGSAKTLSADGGKNTELTSITVDGVTVTINPEFNTVPIIPVNNPTINITSAMTFQPAAGTTFKVSMNGRDYEYNLTQSGSSYILTLEGMSLTQSDNKYTLPGGSNWLFHEGTVNIDEGVSVTVTDGTKISGESGHLTATADNGHWTRFGELTTGDKFTISTTSNSTTYKMLGGSTLGQYDANGNISKFYNSALSDATISYADLTGNNYKNVTTLTDGVLDLTAQPASSPYTVEVYGTTDGEIDPTKNIASYTYTTAGGYSLGNSGTYVSELESISMGTVKTLTTTIYAPVTTARGSDTYTVNGTEFEAANSSLTLLPSSGGVTLTGGRVNLTAGKSVLTNGGTITARGRNNNRRAD